MPHSTSYITTYRDGVRPTREAGLTQPGEVRVETSVTNPLENHMKLFKLAKNFRNDEDGAVTVDWVVLTAAIVGLGIAVLTSVTSGTKTLTEKVSSQLSGQTIKTTF